MERETQRDRDREGERAGGGQPPDMYNKKVVLKSLAKFTAKHQCQSLFFMKLLAKGSAQVLCRKFWEGQLLGTNFSHNTPEQLLLGKYSPEMVLSSNN